MNELAQIKLEQEGDVVVARILGEVDISNAGQVRQELMDAVPNSARGIVVDVSSVGHLDSSGVALLFELARALDRRQQGACVVAPETALSSRVLHITHLEQAVPMVETVGEGVETIAGTARGGG
jgi:anti-anti-sigma factor